ncbi:MULTISPECIES: hypothetical protein [Paenibacillus]|uniref:hypothetical protein n=1 Tax=Paenibacillus TaxID=44249 RepID=UPI001F1049E9|nr:MULTISPECIES: hypothetical protein [Paenibacillus]
MFRLYSDVRGTAYERLIDYAMERADTFMLGVHKWVTEDENGVTNKGESFDCLHTGNILPVPMHA